MGTASSLAMVSEKRGVMTPLSESAAETPSEPYQLRRGFLGTTGLQWNARYPADVRRFVRGDAG